MKKKVASVSANDGSNRINIQITLESNDTLLSEEVGEICKDAARGVADVLRDLRWTDFGPENIKVVV